MKYHVMHLATKTVDSNCDFLYVAKEKSMRNTYKICQINTKTPIA